MTIPSPLLVGGLSCAVGPTYGLDSQIGLIISLYLVLLDDRGLFGLLGFLIALVSCNILDNF
jgi:hypothetical protein